MMLSGTNLRANYVKVLSPGLNFGLVKGNVSM